MSKYQYEPLTCEKEFEDLINDLCNNEYKNYIFQRYGIKGQGQHGIDGKSSCGKIVYQCKKKDNRFCNDKKIRSTLIEGLKSDTFDANKDLIKQQKQDIETFIFAHSWKKILIFKIKQLN